MQISSERWTPEDTRRAEHFWEAYQREHDLSALLDRTAGIDPGTGRIWIGDAAEDILDQQEREGVDAPLLFIRIGRDYYFRKGGRQ